eukprot:2879155-Alexandrium_andersonii.AAC.1
MDAKARIGSCALPHVPGGNWPYPPNLRGMHLCTCLGALGASFMNAFIEGDEDSLVTFVPHNASMPSLQSDFR